MRESVLVIGAGPAGSAAALVCARLGLRVVLVDSHAFPRDKTCGDALIPDALQALLQLGLRERVLRHAHQVRTVRIHAPDGTYTTLTGDCACLPRAVLDDLLRVAAVEAGAEFRPGLRAMEAIEEKALVAGARFTPASGGAPVEIRASATVLATGAASDVLTRFGMCERLAPSATAARMYFSVDEAVAREHDHLCVAYTSEICPGYGWIFPGPGSTFNVGVGYVYGRLAPRERNVRKLLDTFLASFPPAVHLMKAARATGPLKGAPLRTSLTGARLSRPGLLVVGEAAGLTYSFSGEGIGKAIQSGIMAGQALADGLTARRDPGDVAAAYAGALVGEFGSRFRAYDRLQGLVSSPLLANCLIRRAKPGGYVHRQLQGLLQESGTPDDMLSIPGMLKAMFG